MHLVPYVTDLEAATYRFIPELSSPLEPVKPLSRIRAFELAEPMSTPATSKAFPPARC